MKRLSLQWRITLMTVLLIGVTCVSVNLLLCSSGVYYMDSIADSLRDYGPIVFEDGETAGFDPQLIPPGEGLTIVVSGAQERFRTTNWYITAAITLLGGILAYFVSGHALRPLRRFAQQAERVEASNLSEVRLDEKTLPELRSLTHALNEMLERLSRGFDAQRQFVGNAAHELRTPLTLLQTQLELFPDEHPDILPESAAFLASLQGEVQRLSRLTHALLDMSDLQSVPRDDVILLSPMIDEVFADLATLAERSGVSLSREGEDLTITGSDMLLCRLFFNLTENAVKYNRPGGAVKVSVQHGDGQAVIRVADTGRGIPQELWQSIFQPFFRVDKSLSRELGGAGLGLPLVWEIARLHGGRVWVEESSEAGSVLAVTLPLCAPDAAAEGI
ncbi:HAMP domain-containing histidine kinase [Oscillibacter valericigenes]|nr:HAMP domain-containing histidine kinase [Oscillibacter valericigenes]